MMLRRRSWAGPPVQRLCRCTASAAASATGAAAPHRPPAPCTSAPQRVRFAPSPTGDLHLGGLRTALYNYLLARRTGGSFILRVEDTDQSRLVPGAAAQLERMLRWAGMPPDESPGCGGPHAPYTQSERLPLYHAAAEHLLQRGAAYRCFCTVEDLAEARADAASGGASTFMYDGRCRALPVALSEARAAAAEPHTIRLAVPRHEPATNREDHYGAWHSSAEAAAVDSLASCVVQDAVRGSVSFDYAGVDDAVLLKTDGFPTYHLAVVVDDHAMGITTVVRGDEWLPSTPKHELLYQAMGWATPVWAHLPLLLGADGSKLSKRTGTAVPVAQLREHGYLPSALIHSLALCGWAPMESGGWAQAEEEEEEDDTGGHLLTLVEMCGATDQGFSLERVQRAAARFDPVKLDVLNGRHLRHEIQLLLQLQAGPDDVEHAAAREALLESLRPIFSLSLTLSVLQQDVEAATGAALPRAVAAALNSATVSATETDVSELVAAGVLDDYLLAVTALLRNQANGPLVEGLGGLGGYFFYDIGVPTFKCKENLRPAVAEAMLAMAAELAAAAAKGEVCVDGMKVAMDAALETVKLKKGQLMGQVRMAATGQGSGADLFPALALLGAACVEGRLRRGSAELRARPGGL